MFRTDCKKVYSLLRQKKNNVKKATTKEEREKCEEKGLTHKEAYWIKNQCQ
jgi:hypothetical protein